MKPKTSTKRKTKDSNLLSLRRARTWGGAETLNMFNKPKTKPGEEIKAWARIAKDGDSAVLHVGGDWLIMNRRTGMAKIARALADNITSLSLNAEGLGKYDSSLICLLLNCLDECEAHGITFDLASIPQGPRELLRLAVAVPENEGARRKLVPANILQKVGLRAVSAADSAKSQLAFLGEISIALCKTAMLKARFRISDYVLILQRAGPEALGIVSMISFLVGLILAFVGAVQLAKYGSQIFVADLVGIAMVREMGAIMVAIVMSGRTGAAFAAELGSMKVNEEIDAFSTFGISPVEFLAVPRVLALICVFPLLTVFADLMGILGGMVIGIGLFDINYHQYLNRTCASLTILQCSTGIVKSVVFGTVIAIVGCMRGMQCGNSSSAVGLSTTSSVVTSITLIVVIDAIFAVAFNIFNI